MAYSDTALSLLDRSHLPAEELTSIVIGTGIAVAYFRKRRGQRGRPGFFIGSGLGLAACLTIVVVCGLIRGLTHHH